ncbi:MAG TPA: glycolate oxidase subunit GlcF [Gammaproteobacteria bacterium]
MQTRFTAEQLRDPDVAESEQILRKCVHCGFCTATCPTYVLLGDELDSPRGRIYLVKDMLESGRPASAAVARHVDRCLSCLACMTTCPSGVHYQHLIDHARAHVERTFRRPAAERLLRAVLAATLPRTARFRAAVRLAAVLRPFARMLPERLAAMVELAPRRLPRPAMRLADGARFAAQGVRRARVALLAGCVQPALAPHINEASVRLLTRAGAEVVVIGGCCGAIVHHMGRDEEGRALAASLLECVRRGETQGAFDAVVANASGCGTHLKDYGFLFRNDGASAEAAGLARRARDVTEVLAELGLPALAQPPRWTIAYHSACSMQHGQRLHALPRGLLEQAGFTVLEVPEGHLCCGSAGTYNLLQPQLARALRDRKVENIRKIDVRAVATGNVGCITQLAPALRVPIVHTVELLDWATGGPRPAALGGTGG